MAIKDYSNIVANARKKKKDEEEKSSVSSSGVRDYSSVVDKQILSKTIGVDTLQSDLTSLSKTIDSVYNGWQTRETMENTRSSVQSMFDRLGKYQEYQKKYGGTDLSDLQSAYKSVLDGWDDLSKQYGKYKDANAYKGALKEAKKQAKEIEGMKTADIGSVQTEIKGLEEIYNIAKGYNDKATDYSKQSMNLRNPSAVDGFSKNLKKLTDERDAYLKSVGYESMDALEKALGEKKQYKNKAEWIQKGIEMSSVGDKTSKNYDKDFAKKSKYIPEEKPKFRIGIGTADVYGDVYEFINADEKKRNQMVSTIEASADAHLITTGYEYMTDQEVSTYNYYYNEFGKEKAKEYLNTIAESLGNRKANADFKKYEGKAVPELLYGVQAGLDQFATGTKNLFNTSDEYIPVNSTQQLSGMIRDDLTYEHGNWGKVPYDLITTTTNMMPSILVSTGLSAINPVLGQVAGAGLMGASAAGNAYQEMLNLGYDRNQAQTYSILVGASEAGLQYLMGGIGKLGGVSGKLSKVVSGIDNGLAKFAIRWGGSMLSEGFEEAAQEVLNPLFMNLAAGYDTGADVDWSEVVYSGLLGALSGGVMEGGPLAVNSYTEHSFNKNMGQTIKANERISEVFDIASNPEIASAYETYTRYANKGIAADNISDAQLGRLYSEAYTDAKSVSESKKSTVEQKNSADKIISDLDTYGQYNSSAKISKKDIKSKYADADTIDALISEGLESAEGTESHTLATEYKAKIESGKNLSTEEISKLVEANDKAFKTEDSRNVHERLAELGESSLEISNIADIVTRKMRGETITMDEANKLNASENGLQVLAENVNEDLVSYVKTMDNGADANLFVSLYDGHTDVDAYANAFNLTMTYAKKEFTYDHILKNKGVLSTEQVNAIYRETRIKADREKQETIKKLNKKMADKKFYKGFIKDSVIDYENTSAEGKVNWNDLSVRQKQAVTFLKGFAEATGINLVLEYSLKSKKAGWYNVTDNTITINIAGYDIGEKILPETIIPTMSHELVHWMKEKSPELWRNLNEIVFTTLTEHYNSETEQAIKDKLELLRWADPDKRYTEETVKERVITEEDIIRAEVNKKGTSEDVSREEIVARACEDMLKMSERGKRIFNSMSVSQQKTFMEKVKAIVNDLLNWVNDLLSSYSSTSKEALIMQEYQEQLQKAAKVWDEMLGKAIEANQSLEKSGAYEHDASAEGEVRYEIREEYVSEIAEWEKDGMPEGETFILGTTGDVLQGLGAIESDIYMLGDKIKDILEDHPEMSIDEIKKIPQILENPILILKSQNVGRNEADNTRMVIFGNVKVKDGKPVLSVLDLRPKENNLVVDDMQKVSSAYTKDTSPVDFVRNSLVVYADKKRTTKLLRTIGFSAPIELQLSGYIGSISYMGQNVNINGEEFSKVFKEDKILYAERNNDGYAKAQEMQIEINQLTEEIRTLEKGDDFKAVMDSLTKSIDNNNAEKGIEEYNKWKNESGYAKAYERRDTLQNELSKLKKDLQESAKNKALEEERKAIEKSGLSEADYFRKQAVKEFGYTPYFYDAGYITPNGKMLNFSGEKGQHYGSRGQDHRAIGTVYANVSGSQAMVKFMGEGNIRIMAESPGLDISSVMNPTTEQYATIRKFVREYANKEYFNVDLTDVEGHTVGNYEYEGKISAERVVNDIKYFFENGVTREQSSISQFLYSERDTEYMNAVESGDVETASKLIEDAAEKAFSNSKVRGNDGKLKLVYHGTVNDFTVFDRQFANIEGDFGKGYYFTSNEYDVDANYANEEGPDLKNKIAHLAEKLEWEAEYSDLSYEEREEIARQKFITSEPNTITAYLNMENPVYITPDENGTLLDFNESYDEEYDEYGEPEGLLVDFIEALYNNASDYAYRDVDFSFLYEYAADNGGVYASDAVKIIKERIVDELTDENGDLAINEVIRLAFEEIGFDGIIDTSVYYKFRNMSGMDSGTTHYIVFDSTQIKSADIATYDDNGNVIPLSQRFNTENDDIRYSDRGTEYAYETLVAKPDMKLTSLDGNVPSNRADIIYQAKKNAAKVGSVNAKDKTVSVYVDDIGKNVMLGTDGLQHGLARGKNIQNRPIAIVTLKAGEIIKNSIRINELTPSKESATGAYVLIGSAIDSEGNLYLVRSVVNEYGNKLASMDVLYAINTKKESAMLNASRYAKKSLSVTDSTISIAELLDYVNKYFPDILPESVLRHYGYDARPDGDLGEDALYSERDNTSVYDIMGEKDRLLKENERFKEEIDRLNERLKLERKVTKGNFFNENQLGAVAGHLRNISNSTFDKVELMKSLKDAYSFIAHSENLTWEEVYERCHNIAESMLKESKPEVMVDDYYKQLLKDIRGSRISLSESQKKEAQNVFDKNWNRYFFNRVTIAEDGTGIDVKWQEWAEKYPGIFDTEISDGDMIVELYDIINTAKDASEVVVEYDMAERTRWLANEIYNQYWNVSPIRTTADKYDKQIKRLNFEHRRAMAEMRENYKSRMDARLKEQHKADKEKYRELAQKIRERKDKEIALAKQHGRDMMTKYKENAERKTTIQSITAKAMTLNKWLTKNSKDYHIHEAMKGPVIKLLQAIDFSSKRMLEKGEMTQNDISFTEAFAEVRAMLQDADNMVVGLESLYGHDLAENIKALSEATYRLVGDNNYVINAMSNEELKHLDRLVSHIKKVVSDLNKFHTIHHNQGAVNLANEFMEHGEKIGNLKKQHGKAGKFLEFRNRTPYYFFKDLGNVGKKIFEAFQDGWDKLAFNAKRVIDFANETYTAKEVKEWSKETKEFKVQQFDGSERTFKMSIAQIMALHCVSKQEDALRHLMSGGMTLKRIDKKGHVVADYENITLSLSDIQSILSTLDDRQREVADKLQNFMNTVCSSWGNEISMARFGIEMFGLPDYFPIKVSEARVPTDNTKDIDNASLFRLLIMSFTKSRNKYAEQSIEIGDIFDIFAQHASDMAKYNALALPVLDFNKFYSIHGKDGMGKEYGVVKTLISVFGDEANGYLRRFVRDINGSQNVSRDVIGNTFFKNAKVASVANNLRVVLLQPTAFHKASAVLDNKYLMKASAYIKVEPISMVKKLKKAIENAEKYCGIIQWKSLGYYDTDISKGLTEKIKHADTFRDKAIEKSMKGAEIADKVTFGTLWVACEFEIRDTRKDLKVGSAEFYDAVGKRLREVIYATQVVDSTMTRSDMMRSSDGRDKMFTTFGSEPIIAYNMLLDVVTQFNRDKKEFGKKEAVKKNMNHARKVITAYVMTNVAAALIESAFDILRDDDDEEMDIEEFMKLYLKNFAYDMSIGNKLPYVKDIYGLIQGYSSSRMDTQWAQYLISAINAKKPSKAIRDSIRLLSQVSGIAFYNVYRDLMATLNKLDIFTTDDLNEMFGDFLD